MPSTFTQNQLEHKKKNPIVAMEFSESTHFSSIFISIYISITKVLLSHVTVLQTIQYEIYQVFHKYRSKMFQNQECQLFETSK
jgi:hypothetical protein